MPDELRDRDDLHAYLPPTADAPERRVRWRDAQDRIIAMRFGFYVGVPLFLLLEVLVARAQTAGRIGQPVALLLSLVVVPGVAGAAVRLWVRVLQGVSAGLVDTLTGARGQPATTGFSREEALVMRGQVEAAADACLLRVAEEPTNIDARLRLAALQAGPLEQLDEARATYLAARAAAAGWRRARPGSPGAEPEERGTTPCHHRSRLCSPCAVPTTSSPGSPATPIRRSSSRRPRRRVPCSATGCSCR